MNRAKENKEYGRKNIARAFWGFILDSIFSILHFLRSRRSILVSLFSILILALPFFIHPYVVKGGSMSPTLRESQRLVVETFSHRFVAPRRGEVMVLHNPHDKVVTEIKRVVGLPTEHVEMGAEGVIVTKKDGTKEHFAEGTAVGGTANGPYRVQLGDGDYFVLGDNRSRSSDSRAFGAVNRDDLVGRVIIKL